MITGIQALLLTYNNRSFVYVRMKVLGEMLLHPNCLFQNLMIYTALRFCIMAYL